MSEIDFSRWIGFRIKCVRSLSQEFDEGDLCEVFPTIEHLDPVLMVVNLKNGHSREWACSTISDFFVFHDSTIEKRIEWCLLKDSNKWFTAAEISAFTRDPPGSVASQLSQMGRAGTIVREKNRGPRGGYGYRSKISSSSTHWDRLLGEDLI